MTTGKLDTELEPTSPKKTVELKFTDYSINKFKPNYNGKKKVSEKIIDSGIKGLKLNCIKSTGNKYLADEIRPYKYGPNANPHKAKQLKCDTFWGHEERTGKDVTHPDDHQPKTDTTDPST